MWFPDIHAHMCSRCTRACVFQECLLSDEHARVCVYACSGCAYIIVSIYVCVFVCTHMCVARVHICVFTCTDMRVARVHICVFICTHMCVLIRHVCVFQENTCLLSDERTGVCVFRVHIDVSVHVCAYVCSRVRICVFQVNKLICARRTFLDLAAYLLSRCARVCAPENA